MDLVYICKSGDNEELRYSIRSAVKNLPHNKIWVVGQKPDWYIGNFIPVSKAPTKYESARRNLYNITINQNISEDFILMNDDFFILKPIDILPSYHRAQNFIEHANTTKNNAYANLLLKTKRILSSMGIQDPRDFELHIPMQMNKQGLSVCLKKDPGLWRSLFGNLYHTTSTPRNDVKVFTETVDDIDSYDFISTEDDNANGFINNYLVSMFPEKTIYEE